MVLFFLLLNQIIITFAMNIRLVKTTYHKKHGADRICFTHHPNSVICSSRYNLESTGGEFLGVKRWWFEVSVSVIVCENWCHFSSFWFNLPESLRYLSMYDNRCLRYFKGHKERFGTHDLMVLMFYNLERWFNSFLSVCKRTCSLS